MPVYDAMVEEETSAADLRAAMIECYNAGLDLYAIYWPKRSDSTFYSVAVFQAYMGSGSPVGSYDAMVLELNSSEELHDALVGCIGAGFALYNIYWPERPDGTFYCVAVFHKNFTRA